MGLLDDAIRDHLDLKRRRGADPGEVERAEREALGPVRRNPTAAELAEAEAAGPETAPVYDDGAPAYDNGAPAYDDAAPAYDQADNEGWSHDSLQEPPPALPAAESAPVHEADDPLAEEPFDDEAPFGEEPAHAPFPAEREAPAPPGMGGVGPETAEYNVEDVLAAEKDPPAGDGEDVLEETPEFLQDTPDHDRLWFEQRPPKDFDFDE